MSADKNLGDLHLMKQRRDKPNDGGHQQHQNKQTNMSADIFVCLFWCCWWPPSLGLSLLCFIKCKSPRFLSADIFVCLFWGCWRPPSLGLALLCFIKCPC